MASGCGLFGGMLPEDRPRERLARLGPRALMDEELFALLIGAGTKGSPVQQVSQALLKEAGSLATMATWEAADFVRVRGLGPAKAAELSAVMELVTEGKEFADGSMILGSPAKVVRVLDAQDIEAIRLGAQFYVDNAVRFASRFKKLA